MWVAVHWVGDDPPYSDTIFATRGSYDFKVPTPWGSAFHVFQVFSHTSTGLDPDESEWKIVLDT